MRRLICATLAAAVFVSIVCFAQPEVSAQSPDEWWITGSVTNETGAEFPNVNVTAENTTSLASYHALVNSSGEYNISLPVGIYNVSASYANYTANITYTSVHIGPGFPNVLDFRMIEILGVLSGHVTNATVPIQGATIVLTGQRNYSAISTSPLGGYTIDRILPGTYVAHAEKMGYWTAYHDTPVVITRGKITDLNFTLLEQPTTLFGKVTSGGTPLSGVKVTIASTEYTTSTSTDTNGNYTISSIPVGTYSVVFEKEGYEEKTVQVSLSPFESKRYDLDMESVPVSGGTGFIPGFDLPHSLMIVGLCASIAILIICVYVRYRVAKKPDLLAIEREEEEPKKGSEESEE